MPQLGKIHASVDKMETVVTNLCKKVTNNSEFYRITTYKFTN
jgi:hypothetical protein